MNPWTPLILLGLACNGEDTGYVPTDGVQVVGLSLSPDPATERHTLICEWDSLQGATEATIAWELNEVVISGLEEATLDGTWFDKKDKVACLVTPVADGADTFRSNTVKIADADPEVLSVVITPEEANENHILHAEVDASDPDPGDELRLRPHFAWYVIEGGSGDPEIRGVDEDALGQTYWAEGDVVFVEAWVSGGGGGSDRVESAAIVIGNTPPEPPVVLIEEASDLSSLSCLVVEESLDLDGDEVSYTFLWRRFGVELAVTDADLAWPDPGASYTCEATPVDDNEEGEIGVAHHEVSGDPIRYRWIHDDAGARAGEVLATFPDADGDGRDEILVATTSGSLESVEGGGLVMLNSRAVDSAESALPGSEWIYRTLSSPNQKEHFGQSLGWTPDLDGDGVAEILVGAPEAQDVERVSGLVAIVPSASWTTQSQFSLSTKQEQDEMWWYPGDTDGALLGSSVAGLDANGDGVGDVAVGALMQHGSDQGNVTLLDGTTLSEGGGALFNDAVLVEINGEGGRFGRAMVVGDYDGDGLPDLAVGAPSHSDEAGGIYIFTGLPALLPDGTESGDTGQAAAAILSAFDATTQLLGQTSGDGVGGVLAAGDLDNDGLDDLLIGAPRAESLSGSVFLWPAGTGETAWRSYVIVGADEEELGSSVSMTGDLDGGGIGDLIAGAVGSEQTYPRGGGAYVFLGEDWGGSGGTLTAADATWVLPSEAEGERAGYAVLGPGDFDGDGQLDLVTGAPGIDAEDVGVDVGGISLWVDLAGL